MFIDNLGSKSELETILKQLLIEKDTFMNNIKKSLGLYFKS